MKDFFIILIMKILNILSEITTGDEKVNFTSSRRNQKPYKRDDD